MMKTLHKYLFKSLYLLIAVITVSTPINVSAQGYLDPVVKAAVGALNKDLARTITNDFLSSLMNAGVGYGVGITTFESFQLPDLNPMLQAHLNPMLQEYHNPILQEYFNLLLQEDLNQSLQANLNQSLQANLNQWLEAELNQKQLADFNQWLEAELNQKQLADFNQWLEAELNQRLEADFNQRVESDFNQRPETFIKRNVVAKSMIDLQYPKCVIDINNTEANYVANMLNLEPLFIAELDSLINVYGDSLNTIQKIDVKNEAARMFYICDSLSASKEQIIKEFIGLKMSLPISDVSRGAILYAAQKKKELYDKYCPCQDKNRSALYDKYRSQFHSRSSESQRGTVPDVRSKLQFDLDPKILSDSISFEEKIEIISKSLSVTEQ